MQPCITHEKGRVPSPPPPPHRRPSQEMVALSTPLHLGSFQSGTNSVLAFECLHLNLWPVGLARQIRDTSDRQDIMEQSVRSIDVSAGFPFRELGPNVTINVWSLAGL